MQMKIPILYILIKKFRFLINFVWECKMKKQKIWNASRV